MKNRTRFPFSLVALAEKMTRLQGENGKPISRRRVHFMLHNPSQGANRQRLMAALKEMGLNKKAAERFVDNQKSEK